MLVCRDCGQENPEIARFCLACGNPLAGESGAREERRVVSIIFVDVVGFTARAEQLDPEDVRAILVPYHERVRREIQSFGGVVEKFIGDAVMGVFGAPVAYGDDAERAIRAALVVRESVQELNDGDSALDLQIRVAVNTGEALVSLGARPELGDAMVAGDVVNTAARLQAAAPIDGIIVGEETYRATRESIEYEPAPPVVAKGKVAPIAAWLALRALGEAGERPLTTTGIVGRQRELEALRGLWERTSRERTPQLVTIFGAAGMGKTRLGVEFAHLVEEGGGRVVRGRSLPYRESSAYGGFASQVKQLCGIYETDPVDVAADKLRTTVATLLPDAGPSVAEHLGLVLGLESAGPVADRDTLFFSIGCFVEAVAREGPVALVFEDIHWADHSLLDLVELLATRLHDLPLLLLALTRHELLDGRPGWGGAVAAHTTLTLGPLTADDARALAAQRLGVDDDDDGFPARAADIATIAAGNPLFIEQLAAAVGESPGLPESSLPTTVRGIVAARLDGLPPAERATLLDAAVIGKIFWRGALERMGSGGDDLSEVLAALERRDLVRRESRSMFESEQQYIFKHLLIRDVAYDLIPRAKREERHGQAAAFFEGRTSAAGEAASALARHWRAAGNHERAVEHFVQAAEQAERGWAKDHAVLLYREALQLVPEDDVQRRSGIVRRLAVASQALFHVPDVRPLGR